MLALFTEPGLLYTLLPLGVLLAGFVTFEVAMGVTISTLPRSRFQQTWSVAERRRVMGVFVSVFSVWPIGAMLIVSHVYLSMLAALAADGAALVLVVLAVRWYVRGVRQRRMVMSGFCANCLYDLRGKSESERCPECGTALYDHPVHVERRRRAARALRRQAATSK